MYLYGQLMCVHHITVSCLHHSQDVIAGQESHNLSPELKAILLKLASLNNHKNSKVALAAQKVRHYITYTAVVHDIYGSIIFDVLCLL